MKTKQQKFNNPTTHGYTRVATVVPKVSLGNPIKNYQEHSRLINTLADKGVYYALFPELSLTGYSCGDLFLDPILLDYSLQALHNLLLDTKHLEILFSIGLPVLVDSGLYNCVATCYGGQVLGVAPKSYLPNYREFYEKRHFVEGAAVSAREITLFSGGDQQTVPFGSDIIFVSESMPSFQLHTEVCEDIWVPLPPSSVAALQGATVLANASASNITLEKSSDRKLLVQTSSLKNIAIQLYAAAGYGESTTDLAWDGDSYIAEKGGILTQGNRFMVDSHYEIADVDLEMITRERKAQNTFHDNAKLFKDISKFRSREISDKRYSINNADELSLQRSLSQTPFVPTDIGQRQEHCDEIFKMQCTSLMRRLEQLPPEKRKLVIGVSGGQDSTLALLAAVKTIDMLKLPREQVIGITMPGFGTTSRTKNNAIILMEALGVTIYDRSIIDLATDIFDIVGHDISEHDVVFENTQAWSRKFIELATSVSDGGMVLGTGDLSEMAIGWSTMYGDHASHYNVNGGIPKTLISYVISWVADEEYSRTSVVSKTLHDILATAISPELLPARNDKIVQKTDDSVGPQLLRDFLAYYFIRYSFRPYKLVYLTHIAFPEYSIAELKHWIRLFVKRFFNSQYKRSVMPDGPKIGLLGLSPRGDWRMPSDMNPDLWLIDLEQVPDQRN